ncbi:MAG: hypothetical protein FWH52_03405 [Synergistaceae bacterium]|nr:hypothetical protein [Synergistaceae bacterium]
MRIGITEPEYLIITDSNEKKYFGGCQEWYEDRWRKMSGCGPVAASNQIWYMMRLYGGKEKNYTARLQACVENSVSSPQSEKDGTIECLQAGNERQMERSESGKDIYVTLMQEMFSYVTPSIRGVNTSEIFTTGIMRFGMDRGLRIMPQVLEIPSKSICRPSIEAAGEFILRGIRADAPVAFLNLSKGTLRNLDNWHWVTIIAIETETKYVEVCDCGEKFEVDFSEWLKTSKLGGSLVFITL